MKKNKSDNQPLFVQLANCVCKRNDIRDLIDKLFDDFPIDGDNNDFKNKIKARFDIKKLVNFKPKDKRLNNIFEMVKKSYRLDVGKETITSIRNQIDKEEGNRIHKWLFKEKDKTTWRNRWEIFHKNAPEIYDLLSFINLFLDSQDTHREVLKLIVSKEKLDDNRLRSIESSYNQMRTKFSFGKDTYFKKRDSVYTDNFNVDKDDGQYFLIILFLPAVNYTLSEFLSTSHWEKLKQCKKCEKFFVAKTHKEQYFCSDKCRGGYHYKNDIETGKRKEYKRKRHAAGLDL